MSDYYRELRRLVGARLLMMPAVAAVVRDPDGRILLQSLLPRPAVRTLRDG